jgi:hypothetical protein
LQLPWPSQVADALYTLFSHEAAAHCFLDEGKKQALFDDPSQ